MVRPVPDLPGATRPPRRRSPRAARGRPVVHPVPARRADRGGRRLPGGATGGGAAPERTGRGGTAPGRAVDDPHGRVHGLGRDHRPQPAARPRARRGVGRRRGHARGLPPRHVRPRRADAPDPAPRRPRARGRLARRAERGHADRVLVARARRLDGARRVPLRLVLERPRHPGRSGTARGPGARLRGRARPRRAPRRRHAPHERLRPPAAPALARARGGGGQRAAGRLPLLGHLTRRVRRATNRSPTSSPGAASSARARAPTC